MCFICDEYNQLIKVLEASLKDKEVLTDEFIGKLITKLRKDKEQKIDDMVEGDLQD